MKTKFLFIICCAVFFFLILFFPSASMEGASKALSSWATVVLPSLMPFFIAASLLVESGVVGLLAGISGPVTRRLFGFSGYFSYVFLTSAISGYPMGAKLASGLYAQGKIGEKEAQALVNCSSMSGPLFLSGAVCIGMIGRAELAPYLLIPHYLSALLLAFAAGFPFRRKKDLPPAETRSQALETFLHKNPLAKKHIGNVLLDSVTSAISSMLTVGGFMLLYGVLINSLRSSGLFSLWENAPNPPLLTSLFSGMLEMTTGCLSTTPLSLSLRLVVLSGIIGFGGLSIHSQTHAIAAGNGLHLRHFFPYKCAQGALASLLTFAMLSAFQPDISVSTMPSRVTSAYIGTAFLLFGFFAVLALKAFYAHRRTQK